MKRILLFIFIGVVATIIVAVNKQNENLFPSISDQNVVSDIVTRSEWEIFLEALIYVESKGDSSAIGTKNDVGILQITPIYVAEVNRILGEDRYTLEDRISVEKSLEMFCIMQEHHNPKHNIDRAISLHNPRAGAWYGDRIKSRMRVIQDEIFKNRDCK